MSALAALRLSSCRLRRFTMSGGVGNQSDYTSQPASEFHADAVYFNGQTAPRRGNPCAELYAAKCGRSISPPNLAKFHFYRRATTAALSPVAVFAVGRAHRLQLVSSHFDRRK